MTLKQAFTMWACAPRNTVLAAKSRDAVQRVLMKKYNDMDLEVFTESFCRRIFSQSSETQEVKVKAASILVYLLQWGGDNGHCQRPTFTYEIASATPEPNEQPAQAAVPKHEEPLVKVKESALIARGIKKRKGKEPRPVVQIDPETLKPIKTWNSLKDIQTELGLKNIGRAVDNKTKVGGFFWSNPDDADKFKPKTASRTRKPKTVCKPARGNQTEEILKKEVIESVSHAEPAQQRERPSLQQFTDKELADELKARGWKGELTMSLSL